jgi:hypothetical protein
MNLRVGTKRLMAKMIKNIVIVIYLPGDGASGMRIIDRAKNGSE